jgi:arylsulfatase A-like enzyme
MTTYPNGNHCFIRSSCLLAILCVGQAFAQGGDADAIPILSYSAEKVDGFELVVAEGARAGRQHLAGPVAEGDRVTLHRPFPTDGGYRAEIRNVRGRARIHVATQPLATNSFGLQVAINDLPFAGAAPLAFDVVAVELKQLDKPKNVVLISIDTLRPDRLSCYGYARKTSPALDRFAEQGVRFTEAFSTSSFTPPAHASMLTGQYVQQHGLLYWNRLPEQAETLAEVLGEYGYYTGAITAINMLSQQSLDQGFEWQVEDSQPWDARRVVNKALDGVRRHGDRPFFLFLHMYDVHRPFCIHRNWYNLYDPSGDYAVGETDDHYSFPKALASEKGLSEADLKFITDRYDAGINYVDAHLAPLLEELSTPDRLEDTLVVITSDHGEALLERDELLFEHDVFLHGEVTRVPMIVRYPGARGAGGTTDELVSLIDIAPTVLDVLGIPGQPQYQGQSLVPLLDQKPWERTELFMESWGNAWLKAARTSEWLVLDNLRLGTRKFYDLKTDPSEARGAAEAPGTAASALAEKLDTFSANAPDKDVSFGELSDETIEQLESIGYQ